MTPEAVPQLSVLVITRNRAQLLPRLLHALEQQELSRDSFEIVVVDDGSTDTTAEYLESLGKAVRWVSQPHGGVAKARNNCVRHARGQILAFTDDDCIPAADWLTTIVREMRLSNFRAALLGRTYSELPSSTFVHSVFKDSEPVVTCNFAVTRKAVDEAGGFDEHFTWYFEDEDLGIRLKASGYPIRFVPEMVVYHPSRYQGFRQYIRQRSGLKYCSYMSMKHPGLDVWRRNRHLFSQMSRKAVLILIPFILGFVWRGAWIFLLFVVLAHIAVDGRRAWKNYAKLSGTSLRGRPIDLILFSVLNWTIPFVDAFQMARGWFRDRLFARRKQTDGPTLARR